MHNQNIVLQHTQQLFQLHCYRGDAVCMQYILSSQHGHLVDTRACDDMPFHAACSSNSADAVRFMLQLQGVRYIDSVRTLQDAFFHACKHGLRLTLQELLRCSGGRSIRLDANQCAAFVAACENGHIDIARILLNVNDGRRAVTPEAVSVSFSRCVRKRMYAVTDFLQECMRDDVIDARQRKISLQRAAQRPVHAMHNVSKAPRVQFLGATPPLVRCEPQDPPSTRQIHDALQRHAKLLINVVTPIVTGVSTDEAISSSASICARAAFTVSRSNEPVTPPLVTRTRPVLSKLSVTTDTHMFVCRASQRKRVRRSARMIK